MFNFQFGAGAFRENRKVATFLGKFLQTGFIPTSRDYSAAGGTGFVHSRNEMDAGLGRMT
jgi:hypothetical protein